MCPLSWSVRRLVIDVLQVYTGLLHRDTVGLKYVVVVEESIYLILLIKC